jgi:hypothetical protein
MRVRVTRVRSAALLPGELFSTANQEYWDHRDPLAVGERVYIRTDAPCPPEQAEEPIYRVEILP